jgi:hypothetical protein
VIAGSAVQALGGKALNARSIIVERRSIEQSSTTKTRNQIIYGFHAENEIVGTVSI